MSLQQLYDKIATIRVLEDRLQRYCDEGLAGDLHFNKGQEAIAVGVCAALRPSDRIVTHHRTIAHQIAKGAKLRPLVAELLGKATGINGGRAGEMHISDPSIGHEFAFQLVATCIPVAAGLAYALRHHHRTDDVVVVFFGDAAVSNGQFHEGVNLAAIHRLPILFVCENNHRAGNITPEHYEPRHGLVTRSPSLLASGGYAIPTLQIGGNDPEHIRSVVETHLPSIREGRPFFLECHTERLCWHKQGQRDVRTKEELERAAQGEPLRHIPDGVTVDMVAITSQIDSVLASVERDPLPTY